ncbi:protein translocase subunit SecF [Tepidicaulis sp.]|uniref:protein translocase subunit SecF n=1 Tax=Tepidicaulis sp. TaxID=1920809 RepID=UPI003B5C5590
MRLKLVPENTSIPFVAYRKAAFAFSILIVLASIALVFTKGLNFGIDFKGGTMIEIETPEAADISAIRTQLNGLGLGDVQVQTFGAPNDVLIRIQSQGGEPGSDQQVVELVKQELGDSVQYRRVEVVGPKVSGELVNSGVTAVVLAVALMLIYVWFRFEWQFSIGAVLALVHDVITTIGIFSLLQIEFSLPIIAAILTIVGYSMNDTVVVYDRVRENLRKYKRMDLGELIDKAINETLTRTTMTALTTLLALFALYIFGGEVIRGFTFAMIWGVIIGTYSSIFVAAPVLLILGVKRDWSATASSPEPGKKGA